MQPRVQIKAECIIPMADTEINTCSYLHCQESEVSKLLVETSNLLIQNPGQVIWGPLGITFKTGVWFLFFRKEKQTAKYNQKFCFFSKANVYNYLQAEVFHKPLVPQEIARHVRVSIIDQRPQTQRQQLQVNLLHRLIERCVPIANDVTAEKAKGII